MTGGPLFADDHAEPLDERAVAESSPPPAATDTPAEKDSASGDPPTVDPPRVDDDAASSDGNGHRPAGSRLAEVLTARRKPPTPGPLDTPRPTEPPADGPRREPAPRPAPPAAVLDPAARLRPADAYRIRNGRYEPDTWWTRLREQLTSLAKSEREREMDAVDAELKRLRTRGVRTGHLIAVGAAKGGTGKDSIAITLGDVIASALRAPTLVMDGDWDFGTLGERAPDEGRSPGTILDVYDRRADLVSPAQFGDLVARMPSGCHLLSAPRDPDDMERLTVEIYAEVVEVLRRFYPVIFVTMAPGVLAPICKWAFGAADQIVFVTDSRLLTADQALRALPLLRKRHPDVPLTLVVNQAPERPTEPQRRVIEIQLDNGVSDRSLLVPYDQRLEQQLDSGTLDLDDPDLPGLTRIALKQATLAVAERLN